MYILYVFIIVIFVVYMDGMYIMCDVDIKEDICCYGNFCCYCGSEGVFGEFGV